MFGFICGFLVASILWGLGGSFVFAYQERKFDRLIADFNTLAATPRARSAPREPAAAQTRDEGRGGR